MVNWIVQDVRVLAAGVSGAGMEGGACRTARGHVKPTVGGIRGLPRPSRRAGAGGPANPAVTDDMLANQPVGYWCGRTQAAVTRYLRDAMAKVDVTQPQYWVLNRVGGGPAAPTREETVAQLTHLADGPHEIARVIDRLLHRGWLRTDDEQRLHLTEAGEAARLGLRQLATDVRAVVHEGISDEEYVAALKVLRRMAANVEGGGTPSH